MGPMGICRDNAKKIMFFLHYSKLNCTFAADFQGVPRFLAELRTDPLS